MLDEVVQGLLFGHNRFITFRLHFMQEFDHISCEMLDARECRSMRQGTVGTHVNYSFSSADQSNLQVSANTDGCN